MRKLRNINDMNACCPKCGDTNLYNTHNKEVECFDIGSENDIEYTAEYECDSCYNKFVLTYFLEYEAKSFSYL